MTRKVGVLICMEEKCVLHHLNFKNELESNLAAFSLA